MHNLNPSEMSLESAVSAKVIFPDYPYFEGNDGYRAKERDNFFENEKMFPEYDYPKLTRLMDAVEKGDTVDVKKAKVETVLYRLDQASANGELDANLAELLIDFYELRYKRILLVEAAKHMQEDVGSAEQQVARGSFMEINEAVYGPIDKEAAFGLMILNKDMVGSFKPNNEIAQIIKSELGNFFDQIDLSEAKEPAVLDLELLIALKSYIEEKYADMLAVVTKSDDTVIYDAAACQELMTKALSVMGYDKKGWTVIIDPQKSLPATAPESNRIKLPADLSRNANELKRLMVHEIGVHVARAQNGEESSLKILKNGTAEYVEAEEGLAILFESAISDEDPSNNPAIKRAQYRYLTTAFALGIDGHPRDARQTFEIMWRIAAIKNAQDVGVITQKDIDRAKKYVYKQCIENAYRGTGFYAPGIIYLKSKVYYESLVKNATYLTDHLDNTGEELGDIMLGKYNHLSSSERECVLGLVKPSTGTGYQEKDD